VVEISWRAVVRTVAEETGVERDVAERAVVEALGGPPCPRRLSLLRAERTVDEAIRLLAPGYLAVALTAVPSPENP
jgi:hypothetical protein